jgi:uncharacterized caspase-like protein
VALCVGVSDYSSGRLQNAAKDARDLAAALQSHGMDVTILSDPNIAQLKDGVHEFCMKKITKETALAIFYYAGHGGVYVGGSNRSLLGKHIMMASCWQEYEAALDGFTWVSKYAL